MDTEHRECHCTWKSGQTTFIKAIGQQKQSLQNRNHLGSSEVNTTRVVPTLHGYKELCTIATQTDDYGCSNGCTSMYIKTGVNDTHLDKSEHNPRNISGGNSVSVVDVDVNKTPSMPRVVDGLDESSSKPPVENIGEESHFSADGYNIHHVESCPHEKEEHTLVDTDTNDRRTAPGQLDQYSVTVNLPEDVMLVSASHVLPRMIEESTPQCETKSHSDTNMVLESLPASIHELAKSKQSIPTQNTSVKQQFKCSTCCKLFLRKGNLDRHLQNAHTGERPYTCTTCDKSFRIKSHLTPHLRTHTGERPYKCTTCDKSFRIKSSLTAHLKAHTGERPYKCTICDKSFRIKSRLTLHLKTHTGERPHKCTICDKSFRMKSHLAVHLKTHSVERPYKCTSCSKTFRYKNILTSHSKIHTGLKPFKCTQCDKAFIRKECLTKHIRIHTGEKPFKCPFCVKTFRLRINLTYHVRTHTGEKPYKCTHCGNGFRCHSDLATHVRRHTGEKPWKCGTCEKRFSSRHGYKDHLRVHTGEKPYTCCYCDKTFHRSNCLNIHVRKLHTEEKPSNETI